ncbi:MAG: hypothetical protein PVG83_04505 [Acidimicrobiia bacterium]
MADQLRQLSSLTRLILGVWVGVFVVVGLWMWAVNSESTSGSGFGWLVTIAVGLILGGGLASIVITGGLIRSYLLGSRWESAAAVVGPPVVLAAFIGAFALASRLS